MENTNTTKAKTEVLESRLIDIPFESLWEIGKIFEEGAIKYGASNWKKGVGDKVFQAERVNHALRHLLLWISGDRTEKHLAKVAWFCVVQIWYDKEENKNITVNDWATN